MGRNESSAIGGTGDPCVHSFIGSADWRSSVLLLR
jgi:hypothetical protein